LRTRTTAPSSTNAVLSAAKGPDSGVACAPTSASIDAGDDASTCASERTSSPVGRSPALDSAGAYTPLTKTSSAAVASPNR
jgi:hypothetical protein